MEMEKVSERRDGWRGRLRLMPLVQLPRRPGSTVAYTDATATDTYLAYLAGPSSLGAEISQSTRFGCLPVRGHIRQSSQHRPARAQSVNNVRHWLVRLDSGLRVAAHGGVTVRSCCRPCCCCV